MGISKLALALMMMLFLVGCVHHDHHRYGGDRGNGHRYDRGDERYEERHKDRDHRKQHDDRKHRGDDDHHDRDDHKGNGHKRR